MSRSRTASFALALALAASVGCEPARPAPAPEVPPAPPPIASASDAAAPRTEALRDDEVRAFVDEYLALLERISPEAATPLGLHGHDGEVDSRDPEKVAKDVAEERALLAKIDASLPIDAKLSPSARTDLALLRGVLRTDLVRAAKEPLATSPQMYTSTMQAIFSMTAREYAPAPVRAKAVLSRLDKIPGELSRAEKNLDLARVPKIWAVVAKERADSAKGFFEAQLPFLEKALPTDTDKIRALVKLVIASHAKFSEFMQKKVIPNAKGSYAAGKDHFVALLREGYFVSESPDELEAMGKRVLAETEEKMNATAKRIDPSAKGFPEVVAKVKKNHPKKDELLAAYRFEVERARKFLVAKDAVPFPEGDDLAVVDTPEFMRSTVTAAYDQPPPFDPVTRGFFFVTPVDPKLSAKKQEEMLRENDHGDIVDTAVHEAYPGHHLQLSFAAKNPSKIRKAYDAAIFSEGWALYAEEVMAELGYYTDEERLMQLEWTLVRAARIVIDVGLHTKGTTFDDAVKLLVEKVHLEHELAVSEVKRYTMTPTQPLAYLTGREAIFAIRKKYEAREGAKYSLKRFHGELLGRGTLPPGLLAKELDL